MALQILGLRDRVDIPGRKREVFFTNNWRFDKIQDVFDTEKRNAVLAQIPEKERFNLYFTVADCFEERGRKLKEQWAIPFDIDNIHIESEATVQFDAMRVAEEAISVLGIDPRDCAIVFSGHGVQFFVLLDAPILSVDFFDTLKEHYDAVIAKMQIRLNDKNIQGTVDGTMFSKARLARLPDTDNRKPNKPTRRALVLNSTMAPHPFDLMELSGLRMVNSPEVIANETLRNHPAPDTKAVCEGCAFLRHCKANPAQILEPQWYGMLSITSRLEDGRELSHAYSQGHPGYSHYEVEHKIDQALKSSGPRTCKNINSLWGKCDTCENFDKVASPIMIKGPDYIGSKDFGFRKITTNADGKPVPGRPEYEDLIKQFILDKSYKSLGEGSQIVVFDGKKWEIFLEPYIKQWMFEHLRPSPSVAEMNEFVGRLRTRRVANNDWFISTTDRKLNFNNCVLDTVTGEVHPHSPTFGFFYVLPFDYDRTAESPTWKKFLMDISDNDEGMAEVLEEFAGYAISGDSCWLEKALLMVGDGANGKSTYMHIIGKVVGDKNKSSVPFKELTKDTKKYLIVNKLFNSSDETSTRALVETDNFKNLVDGGTMSVKQLYLQDYEVKNRTKFIMAANELPYSEDTSHGFSRRLIIVKFNRRFDLGTEEHDPRIKEKLEAELAGICNSLIAAYRRLCTRGYMTDKYDNKKHVREYMIEGNNVARFAKEFIEVDVNGKCAGSQVYQEYTLYCEENGERPYTNNKFSRMLQAELPQIERVVAKDGTRRSFREYRGIVLLKE